MVGKSSIKNAIKNISDTAEYIINKTSLKPWDADELNKGENKTLQDWLNKNRKDKLPVDERKRSISNLTPMQRAVSTWSKEDLDILMKSKDYRYDDETQKKVRSYFEWKYPGKQRVDATGRPY